MTDGNYIDIILNGFTNHRNYLSEHFYREFKEAEKNHISVAEYFERLNNANKIFLSEIEARYYERINELAIIKGIWKSEGKPVEELESQKPNVSDFSVHLLSITGGKYIGHLWMSDLDHIQQAIIKAIEKIQSEIASPLPNDNMIADTKQKLYNSFNLSIFFSLPDMAEEGFNWLDEDGKITYDINKLVVKEKIEIPRERIAKNESDFQIIFERELKKASLENNNETKEFYAPLLILQTENYVNQHKTGRTFETWEKPLLLIAQKFIFWLNKEMSNFKSTEKNIKSNLRLSDIFDNSLKYDYIMNLLVKNNYCQAKTFIWKDEGKGNKALLASILKYLHKQEYYKSNKQLTNDQIKEISLNTFGLELSIDTIKKAKIDQFDLRFIPLASTITSPKDN